MKGKVIVDLPANCQSCRRQRDFRILGSGDFVEFYCNLQQKHITTYWSEYRSRREEKCPILPLDDNTVGGT